MIYHRLTAQEVRLEPTQMENYIVVAMHTLGVLLWESCAEMLEYCGVWDIHCNATLMCDSARCSFNTPSSSHTAPIKKTASIWARSCSVRYTVSEPCECCDGQQSGCPWQLEKQIYFDHANWSWGIGWIWNMLSLSLTAWYNCMDLNRLPSTTCKYTAALTSVKG